MPEFYIDIAYKGKNCIKLPPGLYLFNNLHLCTFLKLHNVDISIYMLKISTVTAFVPFFLYVNMLMVKRGGRLSS